MAAAALDGCSLWGPSWRLDRDDPAHAQARTEAIGEAVAGPAATPPPWAPP